MANYDNIISAAAARFNVDPNLIRGVIATESSGSPTAQSDKGATGLMQIMPSNYKSLGITDPKDPTQNIMGGAQLLSQLLDRYGDPATALRHYQGGDDQSQWGPVNAAYPAKVFAAAGIGAPQQNAPASKTLPGIPVSSSVNVSADADPFSKLAIAGGGSPVQSAAPSASADAADPFSALPVGKSPVASPVAPQTATVQQAGAQPQPVQETNALSNFGHSAVGLADTIASAPGGLLSQGEYAVRRAFGQSPQQAEQGAQNGIGGFFNQPVAKAVNGLYRLFGDNTDVRNTAGYQNEASQQLSGLAGLGIQKGASAVANATGVPQQDVVNMAQTGLLALPAAVKTVAPVARDAALATAADDTNIRAQPPGRPVGPAMQQRQMVGGGAASSNSNPYPVFTGEDTSRGVFPQVKTSRVAQDVTPQEQAVRAGVVNEIMGDNSGSVRTGVVTGNENLLRDENASAKSPQETPANMAMKAQIASEQTALTNYAERRIEATGASPNLINDEQRGNVINDSIHGPDGLVDYLQQAKNQIYDRARAESGDNPIQTNHVDALLANPQFLAEAERSGNTGTVSGATRLMALARETGFDGSLTGTSAAPGSVAAWDAVRKSNNADWSPANARVIASINRAIDQDIAAAAGSEAYKLGDALHQTQQTIMGAPGFSKIFGETDSNGVKVGGVPAEQIPARLNNMPLDQWQHIYNTLDDLSRGQINGAPTGIPAIPQDLQQMAASARNEMSGSLAREVYNQGAGKAGVWNQNSVNKTLNSVVGQKILNNFPPDEVQAFHTLNYGGQIMPGVHSYEGAAQQATRLNRPGFVEKYAPSAGSAVGGAIGHAIPIPGAGVLGTLGGAKVGGGLSRLMEERRSNHQLQRVTEEMRNNSAIGLDRLR